MKKYLLSFVFIILSVNIFTQEQLSKEILHNRELIKIFEKAYPQVNFEINFDESVNDWKIQVQCENRSATLYWADGKFLPKEELGSKDLYSAFLYPYPKEVADPKNFTQEDIQRIRDFSNPKNRSKGKGTAPFLYNVIYDVETRLSTETHIKTFLFLNKRTNAHNYIHKKLDDVQKEIFEVSKINDEVKFFLDNLNSADSYAWRKISDSGNRSFHSMGLAIDVLPKGWGQKNLYWAWRRDIDGDNWMKLPLDRRWMPPQKVIEIFESHGFLWGGKWIIWDNMHFEYRPEVILYNKLLQEVN